MAALEFADGDKTPMAPAKLKPVYQAIYEAGAMVRIGGNNLMMSPPLIVTEGEINDLLAALDQGIGHAQMA